MQDQTTVRDSITDAIEVGDYSYAHDLLDEYAQMLPRSERLQFRRLARGFRDVESATVGHDYEKALCLIQSLEDDAWPSLLEKLYNVVVLAKVNYHWEEGELEDAFEAVKTHSTRLRPQTYSHWYQMLAAMIAFRGERVLRPIKAS